MSIITIPPSLTSAKRELTSLDGLLMSKQWERAAIIYAFTKNEGRGRPPANAHKEAFTFSAFAKLGIRGLTKRDTVAEYHARWTAAIEDGHAKPTKPGERVKLPTVDWPGRQDNSGQRRYVEKSPSAIARTINAMPEHEREALTQDLSDDAVDTIVDRTVDDRPKIVARHATTQRMVPHNPTTLSPNPHKGKTPEHYNRCVIALGTIATAIGALQEHEPNIETVAYHDEVLSDITELADAMDLLADVYRGFDSTGLDALLEGK